MKTILSDIPLSPLHFSEHVFVFDIHKLKQTAPCAGCFSCWVKTPEACIFQDYISSFTASMKQSDMLYILTRNVYGSYSPFVKCAIDRSLSYVQPYFTIRNHEMHHVLTSSTHLQLIVIAYGSEDVQEQNALQALVQANGVNMDCRNVQCHLCKDSEKALALLQTMEGVTSR